MSAIALAYAAVYLDAKLILAAILTILFVGLITKQPVIGMYLLAWFLPFERIGSVDVAGVTIRISQVIAIITLVVWIGRGFMLNKFKLRPYPIGLPIALFVIISVLSIIHTPNLERSLLVLTFTLFTIGVSIALPNVVRQQRQVLLVIQVLLISACVVSIFGLFQFVGDISGLSTSLTGLREQYTKDILGFPRIQATALEPLYFANYLLIPFSIVLALLLSKTRTFKPSYLFAVVALTSINLILTVSRGGYIAWAVVLVALGVYYFKALLRPRMIIALTSIALVVLVVTIRFLNITEQVDTFKQHITNVFDGASYVERVETFSLAYDMWLEHPWIGYGPGSFGPYAALHPLRAPTEGYKIVNNEYIELLAETGILGLAAFGVVIFSLFIRSWKALRRGTNPELKAILVGLVMALLGIVVQYNTFSVLYIMHIWFTIGMLIAVQNLLLYVPAAPARIS